ncbi:MAG: hypothetical protein HOE62_15045 [Alphaproteobacteria bacterium]|nr:hypothetical protein [Alphaproteobacteria bacterium]MBT4019268.1 hypothetical protein [Alphaproteobacteria bacterium]MBT5159926.1 hypothetical protein [Alphaproteobacteria bacterium]MBT5918126.1 hypothetical protein [Alphaproteobacteria bacterium]MBT6386681.1 hypothetical protein [Alphaproteobacteria bacterium]
MFLGKTSNPEAPTPKHKIKKQAAEILQKIEEAVATKNDPLVIRQLIKYRNLTST